MLACCESFQHRRRWDWRARRTGHYLSNIVLYTSPIALIPAVAGPMKSALTDPGT
jgi:hypothetical protein